MAFETMNNKDTDRGDNNHATADALPLNPDDYFDENDSLTLDESILIESVAMMSLGKRSLESEKSDEMSSCTFMHEGPLFRIYRIDDPEKKCGGQTGSVAMKVHSDQFPDEKNISRIQNEYEVLKYLSNRDAAGAALQQMVHDGVSGLYLDWVMGITLDEWIRNIHSGRTSAVTMKGDVDELKRIMDVARNIAWILVDIHDAGVAHNNIRSDHIIIDTDNSSSVKFISFGSASFLSNSSRCQFAEKRNDLMSLGYIFYEILSGMSPLRAKSNQPIMFSIDGTSDTETELKDDQGKNKLYVSPIEVYSALINRIPMRFLKVIMALIEAKMTTQRYNSASDVYQELESMISDPRTFLFDSETNSRLAQLHFSPGKLYGRNDQLSAIMNVWHRMDPARPPEMILVSGYSGTGKSALVDKAMKTIKSRGAKNNVYIASGKFDQLQQAEPLSAIIDAFNSYFDEIIKGKPEILSQTRSAILAAIGSEVGVLTNIFPRLCQVIGTPETYPVQISSSAAQNRLKYLFKLLIGAITSPSRPLVLFLDDLQWVDTYSLDLIKTLVTNPESKCFLFIGSYRNNEVSNTHPFAGLLADMAAKNIVVTKIELDNMKREDVNELISDAICTPKSKTKSLADVVYRKTSGNVLFVTQFLQSLYGEGLLQFSLDTKSWGWDNAGIETKIIPEDVVRLLIGRILRLPFMTQHALKLISCIGCVCADSTLHLFIDDIMQPNTKESKKTSVKERSFLPALKVAIDEGLVNKKGSFYKFVHDQIQSAAYSLIPKNERGPLHLQIGRSILKNVPPNEKENVFFIAVDQLNRGKFFLNVATKEHVAGLNLMAGRKAMSLAAFQSSASFLEAGISLLCENCWAKNYGLALQLYSSYAEAEFCNGNFHEVGQVTGMIIKNAKLLRDKLSAYKTLIQTLGSQNKLQDAIEIAFSVLGDLGELIPSSLPDQSAVVSDMMKSIHLFVIMEDDQFFSLKRMDDERKILAMKFLYVSAMYCYMAASDYLPFILKRMLDLTLSFGVSEESCAALANCSFLIAGLDGDLKGSVRTGELALLLLEKLQVKEYYAQVYCMVYITKGWTEQLRLTMNPLHHAYERGMQTGDIQNAMFSAHFYCCKRLFCGIELPMVEKDLRFFCKQMTEYKQLATYQATIPFLQAVLNLMGKSENPCELTGQIMQQNRYMEICLEKNIKHSIAKLYSLCSWLAYIFGEYELASSAISMRLEVEKTMTKKIEWYGMVFFYDCLTYIALARKTEGNSLTPEIMQEMEKMKRLVDFAPCNSQHRILLIEAELSCLMRSMDVAIKKYESAIAAAGMNGYIHEQAISYERAGDFFLRQGDSRRAAYHYGHANDLYLRWGAQAKVDHLCRQIPL